jgi:hypothetical protein
MSAQVYQSGVTDAAGRRASFLAARQPASAGNNPRKPGNRAFG